MEGSPLPHPCPLPLGEGETFAAPSEKLRAGLLNRGPKNRKTPLAVPSPSGRVALLGIAHRLIRTSCSHITTNRRPRKVRMTT